MNSMLFSDEHLPPEFFHQKLWNNWGVNMSKGYYYMGMLLNLMTFQFETNFTYFFGTVLLELGKP